MKKVIAGVLFLGLSICYGLSTATASIIVPESGLTGMVYWDLTADPTGNLVGIAVDSGPIQWGEYLFEFQVPWAGGAILSEFTFEDDFLPGDTAVAVQEGLDVPWDVEYYNINGFFVGSLIDKELDFGTNYLSFRIDNTIPGFLQGGAHFKIGQMTENIGGADPVPEPATMFLFATGLAGLAGVSRRKKK